MVFISWRLLSSGREIPTFLIFIFTFKMYMSTARTILGSRNAVDTCQHMKRFHESVTISDVFVQLYADLLRWISVKLLDIFFMLVSCLT
jgi:hypothetical protein